MSPRIILASLTGGDGDEPVMATATALASSFGAHIAALAVQPDIRDVIPFAGEGAPANLIEQVMAKAESDNARMLARVRDVVAAACRKAKIQIVTGPERSPLPSASVHEETGRADAFVMQYGRLADLIVSAQPEAARPEAVELTLDLEAALFGSARPVLVTPRGGLQRPAMIGGPIAIAWNGSVQAARALAASLPFVRMSRQVFVVSVDERKAVANPGAVVDYLAWHGIAAEAVHLRADPPEVGARILAEAEKRGVGLLVMGAYTHSRLREWILGGVTRHVIRDAKLPVLMAH